MSPYPFKTSSGFSDRSFPHKPMAFLLSALSINAYVLPGPAVTTPMRTSSPAMNEAAAKAAWFRKNELSLGSGGRAGPMAYKAPAGARLHGASGAIVSTNDILLKVRKEADKAKKSYVGPELEMCTDRKGSGWTTN